MKKIVGLIIAVSAFVLGLSGLTRKESTPTTAFFTAGETFPEHSSSHAMYFASGGTLAINGNQATFNPTPSR
jgi:hypothetical protein